jgi:drug/metabolite transporter (DMT)-like permease
VTTSFRRALASAELLTAAGLWGFGFIATIWAFDVFSPFELTFLRFALAAVLLIFFIFNREDRAAIKVYIRSAFLPALLLSVTLIFQTWGLRFTTPTKSGFITTLYVVFVPIFESFLSKKPLPWSLWGCVGLALLGTGLIVNISRIENLNLGDVLTFICAIAATFQIYWLGVVSPRVKRPFLFNLVQAGWGALICLPVVFVEPVVSKLASAGQWTPKAWAGLLTLTFGSTVIAFFLQVRAQKFLSATVSSLIFLLESPFALIFALLLLGQALNLTESVGAAIIFLSAALASLIEARRKKA